MGKEILLKNIANLGYKVGFGAKKNLATYDIIDKFPNLIGYVSIVFGICTLTYEEIPSKFPTLLSVLCIYISSWSSKKDVHDREGQDLTDIFNKLEILYTRVKLSTEDINPFIVDLESLQQRFNSKSLTSQISLSGWFAHYKFFYTQDISWIEEQIKFKIFKDKVPASFKLLLVLLFFLIIIYLLIIWISFNFDYLLSKMSFI